MVSGYGEGSWLTVQFFGGGQLLGPRLEHRSFVFSRTDHNYCDEGQDLLVLEFFGVVLAHLDACCAGRRTVGLRVKFELAQRFSCGFGAGFNIGRHEGPLEANQHFLFHSLSVAIYKDYLAQQIDKVCHLTRHSLPTI